MSSLYPNAIDGKAQIPIPVDNVTKIDAGLISSIRSAVINIENELGVLPSGDSLTVGVRIEQIESDMADFNSQIVELNEDIVSINGDIVTINSQISTLTNDLNTLDFQIGLLEISIDSLSTDLTDLEVRVVDLETGFSELEPLPEPLGLLSAVIVEDGLGSYSQRVLDGYDIELDSSDLDNFSSSNYRDAFNELDNALAFGRNGVPMDVYVTANDSVFHYGWAESTIRLIGVKVFSKVVATVGAYTVAIHKNPGGTNENLLSSLTFDMTSIVADTPTSLSLTATESDLIFNENDVWELEFASDNDGLDAQGVYYQLLWSLS